MVEKLKAEYDVKVEWRPYALRPDTPPEGMELPAYLRTRAANANERLRQMARAYGMEMVDLSRILNTRRAHEAAEYAGEHGKGEAFHRTVFRKVYGEGQDISRWEVLRAAAEEVGLSADALQSEVESGKYISSVEEQIAEAHALGITGVPTYILNDRYAIVGAQPYDVFRQVITRLMAEAESDVQQERE